MIKDNFFPNSNEEGKLNKTRFETKGIKSALTKLQFTPNTFYRAVAEFIWNGFDAKANSVEIDYEISQSKSDGYFRKLKVKDNGTGIIYEELKDTFEPLFDSKKLDEQVEEEHHSTMHGKIGIGRLTFITFANFAKWETVYSKESKLFKYSMDISSEKLDYFLRSKETPKETKESIGTTVTFSGFNKLTNKNNIEQELLGYLKKEFCWFLELNKQNKYRLIVNGKDLDYSDLLDDKAEFTITHTPTKTNFKVRYLRWKLLLNKEFSRFYYLDDKHNEKWKETTKLNNQGDDFHHSLYVESEYFKNFNFTSKEESKQKTVSGGARSDEEFIFFNEEIYNYLRKKRKPFLKKHSKVVLKEYKDEGIITVNKKDPLDVIEVKELESVFQELYEIQPKLFIKLKKEQKKAFIGLLQLILKSDERNKLIELIDEIVKLDDSEKKDLLEILKRNKLQKVLRTMNLINDRFKTVEVLKQLVFKKELNANERDHIQKVVEENYWLFGEQYHLVSKDETFQKSLEKYIYLLDGEKKKIEVDETYKLKRMDIFMCQRWKIPGLVKNVILELKSPKILLGEEEYLQVTHYKNAILSEAEFKSPVAEWEFILIGKDFKERFIPDMIKTNQQHGEKSLVLKVDNFKIYAKTWSQIFDEFDISHEFINKSLQIQKDKLVGELTTAKEGVAILKESNAVQINNN